MLVLLENMTVIYNDISVGLQNMSWLRQPLGLQSFPVRLITSLVTNEMCEFAAALTWQRGCSVFSHWIVLLSDLPSTFLLQEMCIVMAYWTESNFDEADASHCILNLSLSTDKNAGRLGCFGWLLVIISLLFVALTFPITLFLCVKVRKSYLLLIKLHATDQNYGGFHCELEGK